MLRIWLTEYDIFDKISGENMGIEAGPNIEAPSFAIASQIGKAKYPQMKLKILGYLVAEIPTKIDIDNPDKETFDPDWDNAIDYDVIMNN